MPSSPCIACNNEGVLVSLEFINGREVDVTELCGACDEDGVNLADRDERLEAREQEYVDRRSEQGRERTLIAFGAGWCES